jgi:hypothetical protein
MSIKKEVVTRTEVYTIYSSEMQERMKVYFDLTEEYNKCMHQCPKIDEASENQCEQACSTIYDKYALLLQQRYQANPEKLNEVVQNARPFDTKKRDHVDGLFYRLFGRTWSGDENK